MRPTSRLFASFYVAARFFLREKSRIIAKAMYCDSVYLDVLGDFGQRTIRVHHNGQGEFSR
jgi:hypothetical protein